MLTRFQELRRYSILATDGSIGSVDDLYFERPDWQVRYVVASTGGVLLKRQVLLVPQVLSEPDPSVWAIPAALTEEQVKNSPEVGQDKPVSRQQEVQLHQFYGWQPYWEGRDDLAENDEDLRSARDMLGYRLETKDGEAGRITDFLVDGAAWQIRYLLANTSGQLGSKNILIPTPFVLRTNWYEQWLRLDLPVEKLESAPEYEQYQPFSREYEESVYRYYEQV